MVVMMMMMLLYTSIFNDKESSFEYHNIGNLFLVHFIRVWLTDLGYVEICQCSGLRCREIWTYAEELMFFL